MERTLIIIKPDATSRNLTWEIIARLEKTWLKMIAGKYGIAPKETLDLHYPASRVEWIESLGVRTQEWYEDLWLDLIWDFGTTDHLQIWLKVRQRLADFMWSGYTYAAVFEWLNAIAMVRKIIGSTIPEKANPWTIRGDYSIDTVAAANTNKRPIYNLIHASGNAEEAEYEIKLRFAEL